MEKKDLTLSELLQKFNSGEPIPESFFAEVSGEDGASRFKQLKESGLLPEKLSLLKQIVALVEKSINKKCASRSLDVQSVNLLSNTTISFDTNSPQIGIKVSKITSEEGLTSANISLNLSVQKLINLPAEELYAVIYSAVAGSVFQSESAKLSETAEFDENNEEKEVKHADEKQQDEDLEEIKEPRSVIVRFIKNFLKKFFGVGLRNSKKDDDELYDALANDVVDDLTEENEPSSIANSMFSFDNLKKDLSDEDLEIFRVRRLNQKEDEAKSQENESLVASYSKQALEILSNATKDSFENVKFDEKKGLDVFARNYVTEILANNGLSANAVELSFNEDIFAGSFTPPNKVNVCLSKVKNVTDFVRTLSHETRHAVDVALGKNAGAKEGNDGAMLDWGEVQTTGLSRSSAEFKFLKKINNVCYRLDTDERNAVNDEVEALRFMQASSKSAGLSAEISKNLDKYILHQSKTIEIGEGMLDPSSVYSLQSLRAEFESLKASGNFSPAVLDMIERRFEYLENIKSHGMNLNAERSSVANAQRLKQAIIAGGEEFEGPSMW